MLEYHVGLKLLIVMCFTSCTSYTPIVLWHGINDSCCNNTLIGKLQNLLKEHLPGVHVISIQIGNTQEQDEANSIFIHPDKQIDIACKIIQSDVLLANGYNGIGYSQGGLLIRGLVQRCPQPKMKILVTLAAQHQGVFGVPECDAFYCNILRKLTNVFAYFRLAQNLIAPAAYWHNPYNETEYIQKSTFLANINNEKYVNQWYISNLQALEKFVMVKYDADKTTVPSESSWFGFYKPGQAETIESLQESKLYSNDRLGLKKMDEDGKLYFLRTPWKHKHFEWNWFKNNIVDKLLV